MSRGSDTKGFSATHWGAFSTQVCDGRLSKISPFERDPSPPPILSGMIEAVHAHNRIRRPAIRKGWLENGPQRGVLRGEDPFVEVDWDTALRFTGDALDRVRAEHGNRAIFGGSYGWASAGRVNHARSLTHRFLNLFGGHSSQVTNYSWGAAEVLLRHVLGSRDAVSGYVTDWASICESTDLMVLFGGAPPKNSLVTSGGGGAHETGGWISRARASGVKFVVVSPQRSDAPEAASAEWIPIRPNTDTAMMLAMAHVLLKENLADRDFLATHTIGFDTFAAYLCEAGTAKTPEWAEPITGVPAQVIRDLAHRLVAGRTMMSASWSLQRADHGEQPYWALLALASMVGQIGLPGGGVGFGYGSINGFGTPRRNIGVPAMPEGRNPLAADAIPCARISDMLNGAGDTIEFNGRTLTLPDIKLIYWAGGNPFHHHQDLNRLRRGWAEVETVIVHEPWWTPLARQADIVLPATTALERPDLAASSRDNYILAMHPVLPPQHEARNDYDIFAELAARFGFADAYTEGRDLMDWTRHLYEGARAGAPFLPDFETFWEQGHVELPRPETPFVMLSDFRADPAASPLPTPSGRIEITAGKIEGFGYDDCPAHPVWLEPAEWLGNASDGELHLLTSQPSTKLHSQLDGVGISRESKRDGRETIFLNPGDAQVRGLRDGDLVRVFNLRGACLAVVSTDAGIITGVARMAVGSWYDPEDYSAPYPLDKSGNPNVLTRDAGTSRLAQGCAAQTALVRVERMLEPAPPSSAHDLPRFEEKYPV